MSNIPISGLPTAGTLDGTFLIPVVDIGTPNVTQQATLSQLSSVYLPLTGGKIAGNVELTTGTLSIDSGSVNIGDAAAGSTSLTLNSSSGLNTVYYETIGTKNWGVGVTATAWQVGRYVGGVFQDASLSILNSDGSTTLAQGLTVNGGFPGVSAGAQPYVSILASTLHKGSTKVSTTANTGDTVTEINVAAQAGARTYTVPDAGGNATVLMTGATMNASGLTETNLPLMTMRTPTGLVLDATGGAALFAIASTVGTSLGLTGANAKSATITSDVITEYTLGSTYIAGQNFNVVVNAKIAGTGTPGTKTLAVKAYAMANDGTAGANIGPATQNMTTSAADYTFAITGTSLTPGGKVLLEIEAVLQETGGSNNINTQINSVRVK